MNWGLIGNDLEEAELISKVEKTLPKINIFELRGEESVDIFYNGEFVCNFNHDDDGWAGIGKGNEIIQRIAKLIGAEVKYAV